MLLMSVMLRFVGSKVDLREIGAGQEINSNSRWFFDVFGVAEPPTGISLQSSTGHDFMEWPLKIASGPMEGAAFPGSGRPILRRIPLWH